MIRTLLALFRIRQLLLIERIANEVAAEIDDYDRPLNPHREGAREPNTGDYHALFGIAERLPRKANGRQQFRPDLEPQDYRDGKYHLPDDMRAEVKR
jgi:hypothetical protein